MRLILSLKLIDWKNIRSSENLNKVWIHSLNLFYGKQQMMTLVPKETVYKIEE